MGTLLLSQLPKLVREYDAPSSPVSTESSITTMSGRTAKQAPPYGSLDRKRYVPRRAEDFGDGGESSTQCTCRSPSWPVQARAGLHGTLELNVRAKKCLHIPPDIPHGSCQSLWLLCVAVRLRLLHPAALARLPPQTI